MSHSTALPIIAILSLAASACSSEDTQPNDDGIGASPSIQTGGAGGGDASGGSPDVPGPAGGDPLGGGGIPNTNAGQGGESDGPGGAAGEGGAETGGSENGGTANGGSAGAAAGGAGGEATGGAGGMDGELSEGCGTPQTLQNGEIDINFGGGSRMYILSVPDGYDNSQPYRLVFAFAESGASARSVADRNYFTLKTLDEEANTIFVAPDAANGAGSWSQSDVELTDAILAELEADLCIDKTRIFSTGFSFGGAMSLALACQRADVFRGVAFFSGADLTGSCNETLTTPIAYYASQASGDSSGDPIPSSGRIKQAQFAEVNGCTPEPDATTFPAPGQPHSCTEYKDCTPGYPTKYCVFDGPHGWEPRDPGENMSWNAPEAWQFITQF